MKKKIVMMILICIAVVAVVGVKKGVGAYKARNEAKDYTWMIQNGGFYAYWEPMYDEAKDEWIYKPDTVLIKTYAECQSLKEDVKQAYEALSKELNGDYEDMKYIAMLDKYDETFFKEKDLVLGYYSYPSTSIKVEFKRLDVVDGVGRVVFQEYKPNMQNDMMAYYELFIEVSKDNKIERVE